jgi:hypothetical protein
MSNKTFHVVVGLVALIAFSYLFLRKEPFTSPGTMVQLATSHVPTEEDLYYYTNIYPKQVRREITDMTGGDPGSLRPSLLSPYGSYSRL